MAGPLTTEESRSERALGDHISQAPAAHQRYQSFPPRLPLSLPFPCKQPSNTNCAPGPSTGSPHGTSLSSSHSTKSLCLTKAVSPCGVKRMLREEYSSAGKACSLLSSQEELRSFPAVRNRGLFKAKTTQVCQSCLVTSSVPRAEIAKCLSLLASTACQQAIATSFQPKQLIYHTQRTPVRN